MTADDHARRYGSLPRVERDPGRFADIVAASGLRGRGGGGFPAGAKLAAVMAGGGRPVVVANGGEGEPPSGKDKVLLAYVPHLVLDGAVLAARALGSVDVVIAVAPTSTAAVERALAERRGIGLDRGVSLRVATVPKRFVSGEETALVRFLNGGPCLPQFTPPRPFERGVSNQPTLIQNVETLANVALVARFGDAWFREVGTADEPGSALVTLSGAVRRPGVYEVAFGAPLPDLMEAAGQGGDLQAVLVGGLFGSWISGLEVQGASLSCAGLSALGAAPGARALVALPTSACGVAETAHAVRYLAAESAGQCGPCVNGLAALADSLGVFAGSGRELDRALRRRRLAAITGRGACRHPDGAVNLTASALRVFSEEFDHHERGGCCTAPGSQMLALPIREAQRTR
jgi:NADH:ubiquinone oxidoreductase subunit F (NADH-binding)